MTRDCFSSSGKLAVFVSVALLGFGAFAARNAPWPVERARAWADEQPWIRGCNYMPARAANHFDTWQAYGAEERFAEVERELALAEEIGFNTIRVIITAEWGFAAWHLEHDAFMANFERMLSAAARHGIRVVPVLGSDCARPKELWKLPTPGPQAYDVGYHGGRRRTQHGSDPQAVGFTALDDPELRPRFYAMCRELLTKYRDDDRILFWNLWNEPGNANRGERTLKDLRELFELAWSVDPKQPLAADVWSGDFGTGNDLGFSVVSNRVAVQALAGDLSDIISFHLYERYDVQKKVIVALRRRWGRPLVNTEWLRRTNGDEPATSYPAFAQEKVGCLCWGFVNGRYQTHEPYEPHWKDKFTYAGDGGDVTRWFHDLFRPSHHPYDPYEIAVVRNVNAEMDRERAGQSLRRRIAASCKIVGEDMWYGYRRIRFDFEGHSAWVVEPSVAPRTGNPWTWTMQWAESFVDRTGVLDLLKRGYHHVTIDLFATRMNAEGLAVAERFQRFLTEKLGLAAKANLVGMSWGGFFSVRYASTYSDRVRRIYLDAPLLNFDHFPHYNADVRKAWRGAQPSGGWTTSPEMPVNRAEPIARAGIPILLAYGGQDQTVPPDLNCRLFVSRFEAAGGSAKVVERSGFGHHPHGFDPDKTNVVVKFFEEE